MLIDQGVSWVRRNDFRGLLVPVVIALVITLGYFALTGNWTSLANPIASTVAVLAGVVGFAVGVLLDRRPWQRQTEIQTPPV